MFMVGVKSSLRFTRGSKSLNTFISDPSFVKLHLERSPKNAKLLIRYLAPNNNFFTTLLFTPDVKHKQNLFFVTESTIVGSSNGLVCLVYRQKYSNFVDYLVKLWNPATRKIIGNLSLTSTLFQIWVWL
ncbi:hypothetical protein CR513_37280, partial [Mucuna pruriens]